MTLTYEKNKEHIKKWRREHKAQNNEYNRVYQLANYKPTLMYKYSTEVRRLMNIRI